MIKLTRIDHRLLHGQVVYGWSKTLGIDCILIANDEVSKDEIRMAALKMAKPSDCKLVIKNMEDSINAINNGITDKYNLLVILETIEDAYRISEKVDQIKYINFGGTLKKENSKQISKAIFVSNHDIELIKKMNEKNIQMEVQMIPEDTPINIMSLI